MSNPYWRGIPVDRLPYNVWQAQYSQLRAAIDIERERVQIARATSGESGESGESGAAGETGESGESGETGAAGASGASGGSEVAPDE